MWPMRLPAKSSLLAVTVVCLGAGFFSNPEQLAGLASGAWETTEIGAVWADDFNRASLGANWINLGSANASLTANELRFSETSYNSARRVYYQPWLIGSDAWTIRWTQRFGVVDANSFGIGVGVLNFQAAGGNDRGYNAILSGAGTGLGTMAIQRWDGANQQSVVTGPAMSLAAGDVVDCALTRSAWTMTATASNRANAQVSSISFNYSRPDNLIAPTISRVCVYPIQGTVYVDDLSFTLNHRRPARFIVVGDSISDGYRATNAPARYISVVQSNFNETVCNDSSSYNTTTNSVSVLPEILAHHPGTAILMIGGNDVQFGYPASQWQTQYSNLVTQLQANGAHVKHCLPTPRSNVDLRPLKDWILANYPASDIIDTWTPLLNGTSGLQSSYDGGDGVHPNTAGHLLLGFIIRTNLP